MFSLKEILLLSLVLFVLLVVLSIGIYMILHGLGLVAP